MPPHMTSALSSACLLSAFVKQEKFRSGSDPFLGSPDTQLVCFPFKVLPANPTE